MGTAKPYVHLLTTGGTIANPRNVDGYLSGRQLLDEVPEIEERARITITDVTAISSQEITTTLWYELYDLITDLAIGENPPDGIVITHGSNTVEETAYFLNLTLDVDLPVVLTAAQRNHRLIGNDGDRNLLDAVRVASHPDAAGRGVLFVANDEIHHAREVTKTASSRPDAWSSGNLGVLGLLDKRDNMQFYRRTERDHTTATGLSVDGKNPANFPRVEIIYSMADADGSLARAAVAGGAEGLVLAATPTGAPANPDPVEGQLAVLDDLIGAGVPVALSHRGFDGWPYPRKGYVWGDTLTPQKARVLLACVLQETADQDEIQSYFDRC